MIVYAESSAVLGWLLGEPSQRAVLDQLRNADRVVSSSLTALECARGLARAKLMGRISSADELAALRLLDVAETSWDVHQLSERILARARASFPVEPIRTLDALHLSTALVFQQALGAVTILSFDERIRGNAVALGMPAVPV